MSYEKQNWQTGDIITADKMNYMEDGIADNSSLIVNVSVNGHYLVLDKTYSEIETAIKAGHPPIMLADIPPTADPDFAEFYSDGLHFAGTIDSVSAGEGFFTVFKNNSMSFDAATANDYPSYNYYD